MDCVVLYLMTKNGWLSGFLCLQPEAAHHAARSAGGRSAGCRWCSFVQNLVWGWGPVRLVIG